MRNQIKNTILCGAVALFALHSANVSAQEAPALKEPAPAPALKEPAKENANMSESELEKAERKLRAAEAQLLQNADAGTQKAVAAKPEIKETNLKPIPAKAPEKSDKKDAPAAVPAKAAAPAAPKTPAKGEALVAKVPENVAPVNEQANAKSAELEKNLQVSQNRVNDLLKQLDETRNRLMIAETQVERLSSIIEARNKGAIQQAGVRPAVNIVMRNTSVSAPAPVQSVARPISSMRAPESKADDDMQIATVVADKVHLRTGPGKDNSPLMAVTKGTRLAVETRSGDWYRVIAPTGTRAWVSSDVVAFGIGNRPIQSQSSRIKGFDSSIDAND